MRNIFEGSKVIERAARSCCLLNMKLIFFSKFPPPLLPDLCSADCSSTIDSPFTEIGLRSFPLSYPKRVQILTTFGCR